MKTIFLTSVVVLILISILNADTAKPNPPSQKTIITQTTNNTAEAEKTEKAKGKVKKINLVKHTLKLKIDEHEKVYTFGSTTKFIKDEKPVELSALKVGDKVVISYDSKNFVHKVKIETKTHSSDTE